MADLKGTWHLESSENLDEYMKALGVGFVKRKLANTIKPAIVISVDGDNWSVDTISKVKSSHVKFRLGEEFEEKTLDDRLVKSTFVTEGTTKLVLTQQGDPQSTYIRELREDGKMVATLEAKGITATRVYVRVDK